MYACIHMCVYIYIYTHVYIYIYIYIYVYINVLYLFIIISISLLCIYIPWGPPEASTSSLTGTPPLSHEAPTGARLRSLDLRS